MSEAIVEEGVLDVVQQLEFEKWRDAELYDDIRDVVQQIASEVKELSNFERYERELQSGQLSWGCLCDCSTRWTLPGKFTMRVFVDRSTSFRTIVTPRERTMRSLNPIPHFSPPPENSVVFEGIPDMYTPA